jgi:hypothetical protein
MQRCRTDYPVSPYREAPAVGIGPALGFFSNLLARLQSGEAAPSLFSSLLRSDEPGGGPPPAATEVAQASRSHFRRTIIARKYNPLCPGLPYG